MKKTRLISLLTLFTYLTNAQTKGMQPVVGKTPEGTGRRIALVIGNKDYTSVSALRNPINDAEDMNVALKKLGFEVSLITNANDTQIKRSFRDFATKAQPNDVALFYYSGHGISYNGKNYLLPTDASINCLGEIEDFKNIESLVLSLEGRGVRSSFIFLDACRNLPGLKPCISESREVIVSKGLVKPNQDIRGSMIVYATAEGSTADDNSSSRNGLFTGELLKFITEPNLGLRKILDLTKKSVEKASQNRQSPVRYDNLSDEFVFIETEVVPAVPSTSQTDVEIQNRLAALEAENRQLKEVKNTPIQQVVEEPKPKSKDLLFTAMQFVEGGTFEMGSNEYENESPIHSVQLSSFYMSQHEITQSQWRSIMGSLPPNLYNKGCNRCPVEGVSWFDIQDFLQTLNALTKDSYRLPTEAEWEYAARGGKYIRAKQRYAGSDTATDLGWYLQNYKENTKGEKGTTHEVGTKAPNPLQLYDMCGNVMEWCQDYYTEYNSQTVTNPQGPKSGMFHVLRGGAYDHDSEDITVTFRDKAKPNARFENVGFRIVKD